MSGATNLEGLNTQLRIHCMVRRNKEDVLKELPPKVRTDIIVDITNSKDYKLAEKDFITWLQQNYIESVAAQKAQSMSRAEELTQINLLRHIAAQGKIKAAMEWINNFMETGKKLVVFAYHKEIQHELYNQLQEYNPSHIFGSDDSKVRQQQVEKFQNDKTCKIMIASLKAAREGITLTAASNVLFIEQSWTPAEHQQAEDRCHRIGQNDSVNVYYLIAKDTIDSYMYDIIKSKLNITEQAISSGGNKELIKTDENIINQLLDKMAEENEQIKKVQEQKKKDDELYNEIKQYEDDIKSVLKSLSSVCDGALSEDGMGFNKFDSRFGKELASKDYLSKKQLIASYKILKKYKKQIDPDVYKKLYI